jgi:hypothetical protein
MKISRTGRARSGRPETLVISAFYHINPVYDLRIHAFRKVNMTTVELMAAVCASCLLATVAISGANETLVELARRNAPDPVIIERTYEIVPTPFERIAQGASLIVHGTIMPIRTYFSDDQMSIYTDYLVTPLRVIFESSVSQGTATPGVPQPIVMTRWGGTMTIEGVQVILNDRHAQPLESTPELVLALVKTQNGKYQLVSDLTGTFGVRNGSIELLGFDTQFDIHARFMGMGIGQFESEMKRLKPWINQR